MNSNFRQLTRKLDLCGALEREEQRIRKREQERQSPQQIAADSAAAYRAGFNSAFAEAQRKIDLRKLAENDPALFFFLTKNRTPDSA